MSTWPVDRFDTFAAKVATMKTEKYHVESGSRFGRKLLVNKDAKKAVGKATVEKVLFRDGNALMNPVFVSDGTSTSYVWCYLMRRRLRDDTAIPLGVFSNNVDVTMQVALEKEAEGRIDLEDASGVFDFENCAHFGIAAESFAKEKCEDCSCVLAVTALDEELGPCGKGRHAKLMKKWMLKKANVLVVVTDHEKLSFRREPQSAANPEAWQAWLEKRGEQGRLHVVTSVPKDIEHGYPNAEPFKGFPDERSARGILEFNLRCLKMRLDRRLIEVPVPV
jgi:DeoR/GlpR family transcriptional regulator of sugar metabolism